MRWFLTLVAGWSGISAVGAQDDGDVVARVRSGGWLAQIVYRRAPTGDLLAPGYNDAGGIDDDRYDPLLGEDLSTGLINAGALGYLALMCHGHRDLLAMTDGEFHLQAIGVPTSDVDLRQFLARPLPTFDGLGGRAQMLDRMVAIDLLTRRRCRAAVGELTLLAKNDGVPAMLRERASAAIPEVQGAPAPIARARLDPEKLQLPVAFDGCLILDHARLPDLGWLTPLGRRLGALITGTAMEAGGAGGNDDLARSAQRGCDLVSELPFGVVHRFGNARLDHSCFVFTAKAGPVPFGFTWQAVGAFEHDLWQQARLPDDARANNPLLGGAMEVTADTVFAATDGNRGKPRPEVAAPMLLASNPALCAFIPANSKAWLALAFAKLPPATGAEIRVEFGDPAVITLMVTARDEDAADAWVDKGRELLAQGKESLATEAGELLEQAPDLRALLDAVWAAEFSVKEDNAFATIAIKGFTAARLRAIAEALAR
ncbi:MAG: hypothetical protein IPK26_16395 [Planctomycetes bacterium]|nr:hypothetical protein [Planctomycetota bacterium]